MKQDQLDVLFAFKQGAACSKLGGGVNLNPYDEISENISHESWIRGWEWKSL